LVAVSIPFLSKNFHWVNDSRTLVVVLLSNRLDRLTPLSIMLICLQAQTICDAPRLPLFLRKVGHR
jgi:hypothetical protein